MNRKRFFLSFIICVSCFSLSWGQDLSQPVESSSSDDEGELWRADGDTIVDNLDEELSSTLTAGKAAALAADSMAASATAEAAASDDAEDPLLGTETGLSLKASNPFDAYTGAGGGDFRYSIPIAIPSIPGAPAPSLSLSYSSESGDGIIGIGWFLTGLSSITRDTSKALKFADSDSFLLDGEKLFPGADSKYHTEREAFFRIERSGTDLASNPDFWKVTSKDGVQSIYGCYPQLVDSNSDGYAKASYQSGLRAQSWDIVQTRDLSGNGWDVEYFEENGYNYPKKITYGIRDKCPGGPLPTICFYYEQAGVGLGIYNPTFRYINKRIKYIVCRINGVIARKYVLSYTDSSEGARQLVRVTEYGGDSNELDWKASDSILAAANHVPTGTALPYTTINWASLVPSTAQPTERTYSSAYKQVITGDFNGDGLKDIAFLRQPSSGLVIDKYISQASGTYALVTKSTGSGSGIWNEQKAVVGDFDGDGIDDIAFPWYSSGEGARVRIYFSNPDGTSDGYVQRETGWGSGIWNKQNAIVGDIDGNGIDDIIFPWYYSGEGLQVRGLLGSSYRNTPLASSFTVQYGDGGHIWNKGPARIADINGDGCGDLIFTFYDDNNIFTPNRVMRAKFGSTNHTLSGSTSFIAGDSGYGGYPELGDFNGDGKTDFTYSYNSLSLDGYKSFLGVCSGTTVVHACTLVETNHTTTSSEYRFALDLNGDGYSDILLLTPADSSSWTKTIFYSNGNGSFRRVSAGSLSAKYFNLGSVNPIDFNGDGAVDLVFVWKTNPDGDPETDDGVTTITSFASTIGQKNLISSIKTMDSAAGCSGLTITPTYSSVLRLPGAIQAGTKAYPTIQDSRAQWVVTKVDLDGGASTVRQAGTITYTDRVLRKGSLPGATVSLGFRSYEVKDESGLVHQIMHFVDPSDDIVLRALPKSESIIGSDGIEYEKMEYEYVLTDVPGTSGNSTVVDIAKKTYTVTTTDSATYAITEETSYDGYGNPVTIIDWGAGSTSDGDEVKRELEWVYDASNWIWAPKLVREYRRKAGITPLQYGLESETRYYYDSLAYGSISNGLLTKKEYENGDIDEIEKFTYTLDGRLSEYTDPRIASGLFPDVERPSSSIVYDSAFGAFPVTTTDINGFVTTNAYDSLARLTSTTDPNGAKTETKYDTFGRTVAVIKPGDSAEAPTTTFEYCDTSIPRYIKTSQKDGSTGGLASYEYFDGFGRSIGIWVEANNGGFTASGSVFDTSGRLAKTIRPLSLAASNYVSLASQPGTSYTYDAAGRLNSSTAPDGTVSKLLYGKAADGAPVVYSIDAEGAVTARATRPTGSSFSRFNYKASGTVTASTLDGLTAYSTVTRSRFCLYAEMSDGTGSGSVKSIMTYDLMGRKIGLEDNTLGKHSWSYSPTVNTHTTHANGQVVGTIAEDFDKAGRIIRRAYGSHEVIFHYDESAGGSGYKGRLTSVSYGIGSESYVYDLRGRLLTATKTIDGKTRSLSAAYDSMDRVTSQTLPGGEVVYSGYGPNGQLSSLTSVLTGQPDLMLAGSISYDPMGRFLSRSFKEGPGQAVVVTYDYYDTASELDSGLALSGRLKGIYANATSPLTSITYGYFKNGDVRERVQTASTTSTQAFAYDNLRRLSSASRTGAPVTTFSYDRQDRMVSQNDSSFSYDQARPYLLTSDASQNSYSYDAFGYPVSRNGIPTWQWDESGLLASAKPAASSLWEYYEYDHSGQRMLKTDTAARKTYYFFPGYEETWTGTVLLETRKRYVANCEVVATRINNSAYAVVNDLLESTIAMVSGTGSLAVSMEYEPYGRQVNVSAAVDPGYSFGGKEADDTGEYYFEARYYDPGMSRFISPDPLAFVFDYRGDSAATRLGKLDQLSYLNASINFYTYCLLRPTTSTDPTGLAGMGDLKAFEKNGTVSSSQKEENGKIAGTKIAGGVVPLGANSSAIAIKKAPLLLSGLAGIYNSITGFGNDLLSALSWADSNLLDPATRYLFGMSSYDFSLATGVAAFEIGGIYSASIGAAGSEAKLLWTSFKNYPKVTVAGKEYAEIGGRLYTEHAVQRMMPSGLDSMGRSISPTYVDGILRTVKPADVVVNGVTRQVYASGTVQVVTENGIVVTVNPFRY